MFYRRVFLGAAFICFASWSYLASAGEATTTYGPLSADLVAVPQNLLSLIHTEEVQKELGFSAEQLEAWEKPMREIDRVWWPSSNLEPRELR